MATTARDLDNAFKLYLDKSDSQGLPDFLAGEREVFLNDAQLYLARKLIVKKSDDQYGIDLRRSLSTTASLPLSLGTGGLSGEYSAMLPTDYLSFGMMMVNISFSAGSRYMVPLLVSEDELLRVLTDPFNKPTSGNPVTCFSNNRLLVYTGQDTAQDISISYYKLPARIAINSTAPLDLPESLMPSLVQRAVQLALESIADPRFATQNTILQTTENIPNS